MNTKIVVIVNLILIFTGALAVPLQSQHSCEIVSFLQRNDVNDIKHETTSFGLEDKCHPLNPITGPTTIRVNFSETEHNCAYQLISFSEPGCPEDSVSAEPVVLNAQQPETLLNLRKSICSYKLVSTQTDLEMQTGVTVIFSTNDKEVKGSISKPECYPLCNDSSGTFYPDSVAVYKIGTMEVAEQHSIVLYFEPNCVDGNEVKGSNGETFVTNVPNLADLTTSIEDRVWSFKLVQVI